MKYGFNCTNLHRTPVYLLLCSDLQCWVWQKKWEISFGLWSTVQLTLLGFRWRDQPPDRILLKLFNKYGNYLSKILIRCWVKYGFHCMHFHETHWWSMAKRGYLQYQTAQPLEYYYESDKFSNFFWRTKALYRGKDPIMI